VLQCVAAYPTSAATVAVRCSVLQCVAVCCSVLQCVEVRCNVLLRVAACCSVLQCVTVCCSALQCVAAHPTCPCELRVRKICVSMSVFVNFKIAETDKCIQMKSQICDMSLSNV